MSGGLLEKSSESRMTIWGCSVDQGVSQGLEIVENKMGTGWHPDVAHFKKFRPATIMNFSIKS